MECGGDLVEDWHEGGVVVGTMPTATGGGGNQLESVGVDLIRESDGMHRPLARGKETMGEVVVAWFVASVGEDNGDFAGGRQEVELLGGQDEGVAEVGGTTRLKFGEGLFKGIGIVWRGGRQEELGTLVEGNDGDGGDIATQGRHVAEETGSGHTQTLRIGLAHAEGVVEQQSNIEPLW